MEARARRGPAPPGGTGGAISPLAPDVGCFAELHWRCDLEVPAPALRPALASCGWTSRTRHPLLEVFHHPDGSEISWVPATGRLRLRVHYLLPVEERAGRAQQRYREIALAFAGR